MARRLQGGFQNRTPVFAIIVFGRQGASFSPGQTASQIFRRNASCIRQSFPFFQGACVGRGLLSGMLQAPPATTKFMKGIGEC
jgi:hypothetical protein